MKLFSGLLFLLLTFSVKSQHTSGHLTLSITDATFSDPSMSQAADMVKSTQQEIYFEPNRQKTVINSMNGMLNVQTFVEDGQSGPEQYMDMMGQKIKLIINEDELEGAKELTDGLDIQYDKSDTKKILDFDCYKAAFSIEANGQSMEFVMYVTDEIKIKQLDLQNLKNLNVKGTPLQINMDMGVMKMVFEATGFSQDFDKEVFNKPEGPYQEMNIADLQKMGMGSFGF